MSSFCRVVYSSGLSYFSILSGANTIDSIVLSEEKKLNLKTAIHHTSKKSAQIISAIFLNV
jgi:hypothetical protein